MKDYRTAFTVLTNFIRMHKSTTIPKTALQKEISKIKNEHITIFGEQTKIDFKEERLKYTTKP